MTAVAGLFDEDGFVRAPSARGAALRNLAQVGAGRVESVLFDPARRPSVVLNSVELVTLSDLMLVGSAEVERAPSAPMISIIALELVEPSTTRRSV